MSSLHISQGSFRLSDTRTLTLDALDIQAGDSWAFVGANGSGKSALARALADELVLLSGERRSDFSHAVRISFEQLQKLVSDEWQRNNTDLLSPGEEDTGRTVAEIIQEEVRDPARCAQLAEQFGITPLLSRRFKYLSTGETRKTLLCRALMPQPDLLILDEPFDGLDVNSRAQLAALLSNLSGHGYTLVLVLNRFDEVPDFIRQVGVLADCTLASQGTRQQVMADALVAQLAHSENLDGLSLPETEDPAQKTTLPADQPLIILRDGVVSYNDRPILNHLDWQVNPGEHWQIVGPNGAGKSTLLSLITGDHPQGYSNDLTLFGRRRGSGNHLGYQTPYRLRQQQPAPGLPCQRQRTHGHPFRLLRLDRHLSGGIRSPAAIGRPMAGTAGARWLKQRGTVPQPVLGSATAGIDCPRTGQAPGTADPRRTAAGAGSAQSPTGAPLCRRVDRPGSNPVVVCLTPCGRRPAEYYPPFELCP